MRIEQIVCDVCGAQKQETNHWFVCTVVDSGKGIRSVIITTGSLRMNGDTTDLCGEACVTKKVSELISKQ